jgi:hypothetical protein
MNACSLRSPVSRRRSRFALRSALVATLAATAIGALPRLSLAHHNPYHIDLPLRVTCWNKIDADTTCPWQFGALPSMPDDGAVMLVGGIPHPFALPGLQLVFAIEVPDGGVIQGIETFRVVRSGEDRPLAGVESRRLGRAERVISGLLRGDFVEFAARGLTIFDPRVEIGFVVGIHFTPGVPHGDIVETLAKTRIVYTTVQPDGRVGKPVEHDFDTRKDTDEDGFADVIDECRESNRERILSIGRCSTGVPNRLRGDGCTIADNTEICVGAVNDLVACIDDLTAELLGDEVISRSERERILGCLVSPSGPPSFELSFVPVFAPSSLHGPVGDTFDAQLRCVLETKDNTTAIGVQAWSISVVVDEADVSAISTALTVAASVDAVPPGLLDNGFEHSELASGPAGSGAVSSVVLSMDSIVTLPPLGAQTIAVLSIETTYPALNQCRVVSLSYTDGLAGSGDAVDNTVVWNDESFVPGSVDRQFGVCGIAPTNWIPYDCNGDAALNMADGICHLGALFTGGATPACESALDYNGDGAMNIADPVALFSFLFLGGNPPSLGLACHSIPECPAACQ